MFGCCYNFVTLSPRLQYRVLDKTPTNNTLGNIKSPHFCWSTIKVFLWAADLESQALHIWSLVSSSHFPGLRSRPERRRNWGAAAPGDQVSKSSKQLQHPPPPSSLPPSYSGSTFHPWAGLQGTVLGSRSGGATLLGHAQLFWSGGSLYLASANLLKRFSWYSHLHLQTNTHILELASSDCQLGLLLFILVYVPDLVSVCWICKSQFCLKPDKLMICQKLGWFSIMQTLLVAMSQHWSSIFLFVTPPPLYSGWNH